jgi:hypothetical protein
LNPGESIAYLNVNVKRLVYCRHEAEKVTDQALEPFQLDGVFEKSLGVVQTIC